MQKITTLVLIFALTAVLGALLVGCAQPQSQQPGATVAQSDGQDESAHQSGDSQQNADGQSQSEQGQTGMPEGTSAVEIRKSLNITEDFRDELIHGEKPAEFQKYIVMHDTEGEGSAEDVVDWWASNGKLVASHFVVNKDGSIVQCVPLDNIAHHAGFGDAGHNELYGVTDESRDDKLGTSPIGDWAPDYGMNSYSVGIEMVHKGDSHEDYPEEQLRAVDGLIAYIDAYYGFKSSIIDHNDWRTGNSDTSEEFQPYLLNLQQSRTHDGS